MKKHIFGRYGLLLGILMLTTAGCSPGDRESRTSATEPGEVRQTEEVKAEEENSSIYYFYSIFGEPERRLYNAMLEVAKHPNEEGFEKEVVLSKEEYDREDDPFLKHYIRFALYCDHPELYWLSEIRTVDLLMEENTDEKSGGTTFRFRLSGNYDNYEIEMARLEEAADDFLMKTGIKAEPDAETARRIHDGLMDLVAYDREAAANPVLNEKGKRILSYESSAYGALVEGRNGPHRATCGGYTRAYQYLLQKCGIPATLVFGYVGYTEEVPDYHVWNMVCLDGEWYETDPTFDDAAFADDFYDKVVRDENYDLTMENVYHLFYNVTSEKMKVRDGSDTCTFLLNDGKTINVQGVVYHKRDTDYPDNYQDLEYWTDSRLPEAGGTLHAYKEKKK